MNHASKQKNLSYFHFNVRSLGKNKHKPDDDRGKLLLS